MTDSATDVSWQQAAMALLNAAPQHYPAVQAGAECWRCPFLNCQRGPVPPTLPDDPTAPIELLVVGEAPGQSEVDAGSGFVGASGKEMRRAISDGGFDSNHASYTNTMLCQPPGNDLRRFRQQNKKAGLDDPIDCCRPRLMNEIKRAKHVLLVGSASLLGAGIDGTILKLRGTPVAIPDGPSAMPVLHPAFVMRDQGRHLRPVFRADVAKGIRLSRGGNTWVDPPYFVAQDHTQLANFLAHPQPWWAVDTETDGVDPWTCNIRRIGIGTQHGVAIYSPLSVKGHALMPAHEIDASRRVFNDFFARPTTTTLAWHNYYGFDSILLAQHGFRVPDEKSTCSLIGHHIGASSELPHGLDFLASIYTDARRWKDDVKHSNVKTDEVLDKYLSYDIAVTWIVAPWVQKNLVDSEQEHIYQLDAYMGGVGRSMSRLGIHIDRAKQLEFASEYQLKANKMRTEFQQLCASVSLEWKDINPGSPVQVRKFLYQGLGLPVLEEFETMSGEASTAEPVLLELLGMGVDRRAETAIKSLLGYREAEKILGTYTGHVEEGKLVGGPPLHADGRLRTTWKVWGTVSGRWSSGDPVNLTNIIKRLRAMYKPAPGNVFVGADYSALELRILAWLSDDEILIHAFKEFDAKRGPDIHVVNACTVFNCRPDQVTDEPRTFAKRFVYGLSYGAGPPKIFQTMSLLRDDNLKPVFPNITLSEIEKTYKVWWAAHPKIAARQKGLISIWRRRGFLETAINKRRRYFIGGQDDEQMKNHEIQGTAADIQDSAIVALTSKVGFDYERNEGLVLQVHDQLVVECAEHKAEKVKEVLQWAMTRRFGEVNFPAEVKIGKDWKAIS